MPSKYEASTKAKAIRLVREHAGDYPTEWAAITAVSGRLGMSAETLRKWIRQAEVDEGTAPCGARLFDLAWPGLRAQIIAE
jgi:transposase